MASGDLTKSFMEVVGDLRGAVNWDRRMEQDGMRSFGSADSTFGDVVHATENGRIGSLDFSTMLWAYGMLVNDIKTPKEVISRLLPPMTEAFVGLLKETPIAKQEMSDLVRFMDHYNKARASGRFDESGVVEISKVMQQMANNFGAKCEAKRQEEQMPIKGLPTPCRVLPVIKLK